MGHVHRRGVGGMLSSASMSTYCFFKQTAVSSFSAQKPEFTPWTSDARYYTIKLGFLAAFVPDPPQYIPVGELDAENSVRLDMGYSRESVHIHALVWNFPSTAIKSKSDKSIFHRCTLPRGAWYAFLA